MTTGNKEGFVLWFTGLPCAGKTTAALEVEKILLSRGLNVERLDGDTVRKTLTSGLGFSKEDRDENIKRVTYVAKLLSRNGVATLVSFISPYRARRYEARKETSNFIEVYVKCPLEVCEKRDIKGMYSLAREGEIESFTGISDPYEEPEAPEIIIRTDTETVEESAAKVVLYLEEKKFI